VNSTPRTTRLKQELAAAGSPETAKRIFEEFLRFDPSEGEVELASVYLGWTLYELET
jgi:hypothetical protein